MSRSAAASLPRTSVPSFVRSLASRHAFVAVVTVVALISSACGERDLLDEARTLQSAGRLEESLEPLRDLLVEDPSSPEVSYRYGLALSRTGKPGLAVWALRRAQEDPEWASQAALELARSALVAQNWSNAIEAATDVLESEPENVDALEIRAESYLGEMTRPELALDDLALAIDLDPDRISLRVSRVRALIMSDRIDEAVEAMDELEPLYAASNERDKRLLGPVCAVRVTFARERGEIEEAESLLGRCLEDFPADTTLVDTAIRLFDTRAEPERANDVLRTALEAMPKSLHFRRILAARLRALEHVEEAEQTLRAGLGMGSDALDEGIWAALAQHYAEIDDAARAADAYGKAVALSPEVSEIGWLTYADMLVAAGRGEEALEVAKRLNKKHYRQMIEARFRLQEGEPERALALFDEVLVLWPDNPGARYFAARAAEQIGDFDRAIEEYRQSIRADAAATDAGLRYARILLALGDENGAWVAAGYHVRAQPQDRAGLLLMMRLALDRGGPASRRQLREAARTPHFPAVVAMHLDSIAEREGAKQAIERLAATGLDMTQPWNAGVLRAYVRHLVAAGQVDTARRAVSEALESHPGEASFHSIAGLEKELSQGGDPMAGRAEYERALALDPNERFALEAMARIKLSRGDVEEAIVTFDRALSAAPGDAGLWMRVARLLSARESLDSETSDGPVGEVGEVEERARRNEDRWREIAKEFPWEPEPLLELAKRALGRSDTDTALDLARRAARVGGGAEAWGWLARIHDARGESELAAQARERAELRGGKAAS